MDLEAVVAHTARRTGTRDKSVAATRLRSGVFTSTG